MKRKKDRSGKVAVIASLVVILLVGVSVFSLYSLSGNGLFGSAGILFGSSENTGMGKLLTHYDETAEYSDDQIQVANVDESYDPTVYPEELTGEIQGSTAQEEITSPAEPIPVDTKLEVKDSTVPDEVKDGLAEDVSGSVLKAASADETSKKDETEQTPEEKTDEITDTDEEMIADLSDEIADGAEDVAGTALMANAAEEAPAAVIQPAAAELTGSFQEEEAAVAAEPEPLAEETVEEEPEEVVEEAPLREAPLFAAPMQTAEVAEEPEVEESDTEETGEWRFDQDTEEWYYVEFADLEVDAAADYDEDTDDAEAEGEWVFDEDTEEWYYVESAALSENAAADYDEDTDDAETEGEWVFDEETEEWYFETSLLAAAGGDEEDEEEGEWVFDEDTEEWYYVAGTDEDETAGEWVLDEETGEWIYVEGAGDADDAEADDTEEDTEEDDIIEPTGEWVFDEEAGEWVYVETEGAGGDGAGTEEAAAADEETVSLGQQIVDYAMGYVGVTPYVWAGNSLTSGTDCSGFVHLIYDKFGIYCSHASLAYDGSEFGTVVSLEEAQPGDIFVYGGGDHVAIYAGNGYVVHCSSPRNGTVYWDMNYRSDLSWVLRVL